MKNAIYAATILFVLAGSTSPTISLASTYISAKKTTQPTTPAPSTDVLGPPSCPRNDPNGCGIFD